MKPLTKKIPKHVAIIMDGNGRWAQERGEPRVYGHQSGAQRVREIVELAGKMGVEVLTLYAFSEENWQRPEDEVRALFTLLVSYLQSEFEQLHENKVKLSSIGSVFKLPRDCQDWLERVKTKTESNTGLQLVLALSYGGRSDIVSAVQEIARSVALGTLSPSDISEATISSSLSTAQLPPPDLLIRTSGEQRLSNFLLWELAYTELHFSRVNWPDFKREDFEYALEEYAKRERRFGCV